MERFCRRSAFTLIEILVVMAIIAILSALLFAAFSRVREKGRASQCQSNLRQLALAVQQYSADSGTYPSWYNEHNTANPPPNSYPGIPWGIRIMPYIKTRDVFQCPSDPYSATSDPMYIYGKLSGFTDYNYNLNLSSLPDAKITRASEVILLFDGGSGPAYNCENSPPATGSAGNGDIHNGGANYVFTDGHAKWFSSDNDHFVQVQHLFEVE